MENILSFIRMQQHKMGIGQAVTDCME